MHPLVSSRLRGLQRLCEMYRVRRLAVFGSAASDRFDAGRSDLDLLVEFGPMTPVERADSYFGLLEQTKVTVYEVA